mmetsp:Transcript_11068/g.23739  ORF Transcript_11068/g.23739 Transcript_11068/m.23739 type:complete len:262 (+) Transcript_11068:1038-1823(+)
MLARIVHGLLTLLKDNKLLILRRVGHHRVEDSPCSVHRAQVRDRGGRQLQNCGSNATVRGTHLRLGERQRHNADHAADDVGNLRDRLLICIRARCPQGSKEQRVQLVLIGVTSIEQLFERVEVQTSGTFCRDSNTRRGIRGRKVVTERILELNTKTIRTGVRNLELRRRLAHASIQAHLAAVSHGEVEVVLVRVSNVHGRHGLRREHRVVGSLLDRHVKKHHLRFGNRAEAHIRLTRAGSGTGEGQLELVRHVRKKRVVRN